MRFMRRFTTMMEEKHEKSSTLLEQMFALILALYCTIESLVVQMQFLLKF
jgi:hypothetical protein